jgi:ABC-type sugar transport system ATPase subunit
MSANQSHKAETESFAIKARNISKQFPGVHALNDVNFQLRYGEVHSLVGANGAGKSTFIKVLGGAIQPDFGEIELGEAPSILSEHHSGPGSGIAVIYQELTIVPEMTALSNTFLGRVPSRGFVRDRAAMLHRYRQLSDWIGASIPPNAKAGGLSVAQQQLIEIMRAVNAERSVIIMDEPTAPLGAHERQMLYDLIENLKLNGVSIIFVSHDLDEVIALSDRISVMRDGKLVETRAAVNWTKDSLVGAMLGDVLIVPTSEREVVEREVVLQVNNLCLPGKIEQIEFSLHKGEVLGIAGLVGSGRTELLRCIFGAEPSATGAMLQNGNDVGLPASVRSAIAAGIALAPEDRKSQGLVLSQSSQSNLILADMWGVCSGGVFSRVLAHERASSLAERLGFDARRLCVEARNLSGGNQQKLVIGKWLNLEPRILLLDEPTRGIDVGAKQEIFRTIRDLSEEGMSVILVSSDLEEVVEHSDRILVMSRGRKIALLDRHSASVESILTLIFEVEDKTPGQEHHV